MQYTRRQIIEYLKNEHVATVPELSQRLNLTITNIRHHVKELESQNILQEMGKIPTQGRGRPTKQYGLAVGALEHNTFDLATALLKVLINQTLPVTFTNQDKYLLIADELLMTYQRHPNPIYRLNQAIAWLNQHNYRARWEASIIGPRLILEHCPYRAVQDQFPDLCSLSIALLVRLIGVEHNQITFRQLTIPGSTQCLFDIRQVLPS